MGLPILYEMPKSAKTSPSLASSLAESGRSSDDFDVPSIYLRGSMALSRASSLVGGTW